MSRFRARWRIAATSTMVVVATAVLGVGIVGAKPAGKADSGTLYVAVTHSVGTTLYAAGNSTDKLLGPGAITYGIIAGTGTKPGTIKTTGTVTAFTRTGSLTGTVDGTEATQSNGTVTQSGKFKLVKGGGGQQGHTYIGTYSGTGKTATGPFVFHVKGIYR